MTTVLVVDDSASDRFLAAGLLAKKRSWTVVEAADGRQALEQFELHIPDLVVTDMQMPEMNGLELVAAVKREYPLIPVVLMTAQGSEELAVQALQLGASSYVAKRNLATELVDTVERVLAARHFDRSDSRLMLRLQRHETSFVLENDPSLFPAVITYLQQTLRKMRLCDESEFLRLGVALEESLLNAYYHGNLEVDSSLRETDHRAYYELSQQRSQQRPYCERQIYVNTTLSPAESVFVIRDEGPGFNPSGLPDATDPANLERPYGRGLLLMKTFMDEIRFNNAGNEVTLVKRHDLFSERSDGQGDEES